MAEAHKKKPIPTEGSSRISMANVAFDLPKEYQRSSRLTLTRIPRRSTRKSDMGLDTGPEEKSFGIFERLVESPMGFYREKDKYYHLKKQYHHEPETLKAIKEMWAARSLYQIRKRFCWPPHKFYKNIFCTYGYYEDWYDEHKAGRIRGHDNQWKKVQKFRYHDDQEDSDDLEYLEHFPDNLDDLDWTRIEDRYAKWKEDQKKHRKRRPTAYKMIKKGLVKPAGDGDDEFENELDDIDFDELEAELLRRKSLKVLNPPKPPPPPKAPIVEEDITTETIVTTEYIVVPKDPNKKKKRKSRKSRVDLDSSDVDLPNADGLNDEDQSDDGNDGGASSGKKKKKGKRATKSNMLTKGGGIVEDFQTPTH